MKLRLTADKLQKLFSLDAKTMLLFLEAYLFLGWARILVAVPFAKIAGSLGESMQETEFVPPFWNRTALISVHDAVHIMSRHTLWQSRCLVRAIAALKMLERRRIGSTLYLGTARDESGTWIAHAWLRSGSFFITGAEEMHRFTVVGTFAKVINDGRGEGD